jgi:hypothetical protein
MRIGEVHSHLNGFEFIKIHKSALWDEIGDIIEGIKPLPHPGNSGRRQKPKVISRPMKQFDHEFEKKFRREGWLNSETSGQTDFVKQRIAVALHVGKGASANFDLFARHLAFYVGDHIDVGVEILPMKAMQAQMSSGIACYEGELYNLIREGRGVPPVPLVLIGIAP